MLGYAYTLTNNHTGKSFTIGINDDGNTVCGVGRGILLQEYPVFELDVRNDQRNKAGQHGIWDFFSFYGQRNITFIGIIMGNSHSDLDYFQDKIRDVLTLPAQPIASTNDGYITVSWTDANGEGWSVDAKLQRDIQFSRLLGNKLNSSFFIGLKADSPYLLSTTSYSQSQLRGWRGGQMLLPAFLGSKINIKYNDLVNIYQTGSADAPGTYRVEGPGTNLKVTKLIESFTNSTTVSDFSTGWSGGTDDIINFQTAEKAQKLTSTGSQATMSLAGSWDLSSPDFITFYFYVDDADNFAVGDYLTGENYIKFKTTAGVDEFVLELSGGNKTIRNGWNYFIVLKQEFKSIGSPSWASIVSTEISIKAKTATTLNVTFDDLRNRDIGFTEKKLELETTLGATEYVDLDVLAGTITRNDGADVSGLLSSDSEWFYISARQNLILCESSDANPLVTYEFPYTFRDPVDSTNILGYWHFDDKDLTQITDYVGADDGTFVGSGLNYLSSTVDGSQYALDFPGTGGYVSIETPYRNIAAYTTGAISFKFQTSSFASDFTLLYQYLGIADSRIEYDQASDELRIIYKIDTVTKTIAISSFSSSYSVDTWIGVIINFDVTTAVTVYIDDAQVGQDTTTGTSFDTGILTSRWGADGVANDLTGLLDEIRYYNEGILDSDTRTLLFTDAAQEKYKNQLTVTWNNAQL